MPSEEGSLGAKIALARKYTRPPLSQSELAKMTGVGQSTIAMIEAGNRDARHDFVLKVARFTAFPVGWFYDGKPGPPPLDRVPQGYDAAIGSAPPQPSKNAHLEAEPSVGRRKFPLVGDVGAAVVPLKSEDPWPGDYVEFSDELYRPGRYAIRVRGDSMLPRFQHGDFLLVQPAPEVESGIVAVAHNDEFEYVSKVMRLTRESVKELHPINPEYPVIIPGDGWELAGYAVGWRREHGPGRYIEEGDNGGLRP